jgi:hypothetical protein
MFIACLYPSGEAFEGVGGLCGQSCCESGAIGCGEFGCDLHIVGGDGLEELSRGCPVLLVKSKIQRQAAAQKPDGHLGCHVGEEGMDGGVLGFIAFEEVPGL